jgi:hypothetical protein
MKKTATPTSLLAEAQHRLDELRAWLAAHRDEQAELGATIAKCIEEIRHRVALIALRASHDYDNRAGVAADGTVRQLLLYDRDVDHLQPVPPWLSERPVTAMYDWGDGPVVAQQREVLLAAQARLAELTPAVDIVTKAATRAARALADRSA